MTSLLREREDQLQTGSRAKSLSTQLWSIPWEEVLPYQFQGTDFYLDVSHYDEMMSFLSQNASQVFTQNEFDSPFLNKESSPAKTRFYRDMADIFAYKLKEKIIGVFAINAADWSTCYFRYTNILPEYRGHNLTEKNLKFLFQLLAAYGVQRICLEVSPSNTEQVQRLSRLGFFVTGNVNSERWGSGLVMTKYLDSQSEQVFLNQFCLGLRPKKTNLT